VVIQCYNRVIVVIKPYITITDRAMLSGPASDYYAGLPAKFTKSTNVHSTLSCFLKKSLSWSMPRLRALM
jgi:hypothetical protein